MTDTTSTLDNLLSTYFEKVALHTAEEDCFMRQLVSPENVVSLPRAGGTSVKWNAWRRLGPASSTLSETTSNAVVALSSRLVTGTVASYGRAVQWSDLIDKTSVLSVNQGALARLTQSAALTIDNLMQYGMLKPALAQCGKDGTILLSTYVSATFSAFCANTGTNNTSNLQFKLPCIHAASSTYLSGVGYSAPSTSARCSPHAINKGLARLKNFSARPYADGKFRAVMGVNAHRDLLDNPDFQKWFISYSSGAQEAMMANQAGVVHQTRIFVSPNMPRYISAGQRIVNPVVITGRDCVGCVELNGDNGSAIEFIITPPGGVSDPFKLSNIISYKVRFDAEVLDPSAGVIVMTHELP